MLELRLRLIILIELIQQNTSLICYLGLTLDIAGGLIKGIRAVKIFERGRQVNLLAVHDAQTKKSSCMLRRQLGRFSKTLNRLRYLISFFIGAPEVDINLGIVG